MAIMTRDITGPDLANELAEKLTDLEFELLVRARIKRHFDAVHSRNPNLSQSYDNATFSYSATDDSTWTISFGSNYRQSKNATGQVLSATFDDVAAALGMAERNKLSLLLAPPPVSGETDSSTVNTCAMPF